VSDSDSEIPQVGQIVRILRGRDQGQWAVVIKVENERLVWIADGDKRKFDSPKKKNIRHLSCSDQVSSVVYDSIRETGRVTNGKLRFALNKFKEMHYTVQEKGE
jgi:large subunit ribosomal protein L14e